jgi:hypothetical protein
MKVGQLLLVGGRLPAHLLHTTSQLKRGTAFQMRRQRQG